MQPTDPADLRAAVLGIEGLVLDADGVCAELKRVDTRFRELTGRSLAPIWRAPGGHTTPNALAAARRCLPKPGSTAHVARRHCQWKSL